MQNTHSYHSLQSSLNHILESIATQADFQRQPQCESYIVNELLKKKKNKIVFEMGNSPSFWLLGTARMLLLANKFTEFLGINSKACEIRYVTNFNLQPLSFFARNINILSQNVCNPSFSTLRLKFISKKKFYSFQPIKLSDDLFKNDPQYRSQHISILDHFAEIANQLNYKESTHIGQFIDESNKILLNNYFPNIQYTLLNASDFLMDLINTYDISELDELDDAISRVLGTQYRACWISSQPRKRLPATFSEVKQAVLSNQTSLGFGCRVEIRQFLASLNSIIIRISGSLYDYTKVSDLLYKHFTKNDEVPLRIQVSDAPSLQLSNGDVRQDVQLISLLPIYSLKAINIDQLENQMLNLNPKFNLSDIVA